MTPRYERRAENLRAVGDDGARERAFSHVISPVDRVEGDMAMRCDTFGGKLRERQRPHERTGLKRQKVNVQAGPDIDRNLTHELHREQLNRLRRVWFRRD